MKKLDQHEVSWRDLIEHLSTSKTPAEHKAFINSLPARGPSKARGGQRKKIAAMTTKERVEAAYQGAVACIEELKRLKNRLRSGSILAVSKLQALKKLLDAK